MASDIQKTATKSRQELRKEKLNEVKSEKEKQTSKVRRRRTSRAFPIWLRLIVIALLLSLSLLLGVVVGYGIIGDGEPGDALKKSTWTHIIDLIEKEGTE